MKSVLDLIIERLNEMSDSEIVKNTNYAISTEDDNILEVDGYEIVYPCFQGDVGEDYYEKSPSKADYNKCGLYQKRQKNNIFYKIGFSKEITYTNVQLKNKINYKKDSNKYEKKSNVYNVVMQRAA